MRNKIRRTLEGEDNWEGYGWEKSCISNELSFEKGRKQFKNIRGAKRTLTLVPCLSYST